ncbi:GRAS family transcription factor [Corchorus olitorius]|uniref:GRAS family transcription factor n=1 Tax=Corchorus olitorius TaxID=93759 RepID=A0A1R3K5B2_9ROSI|nr:GRAS family transcription factor [Corchorus olitorius]
MAGWTDEPLELGSDRPKTNNSASPLSISNSQNGEKLASSPDHSDRNESRGDKNSDVGGSTAEVAGLRTDALAVPVDESDGIGTSKESNDREGSAPDNSDDTIRNISTFGSKDGGIEPKGSGDSLCSRRRFAQSGLSRRTSASSVRLCKVFRNARRRKSLPLSGHIARRKRKIIYAEEVRAT